MTGRALRQMLVVFRKELRDSSRDRRAIFAIVFGVLVGPAVIAFVVNRVADRERQAEDVRIPVAGASHAPALMAWMRGQWGVTIVDAPADPERAVRDGDAEVVLEIPAEFGERFNASRAAAVKIVSDSSRESARPTVMRVKNLLLQYSSEIAALRLVARGVSPLAVTTLQIENVEVSTAQKRAAAVLNFLGLFLLLSALSGGMQLATDSTAGERERGSLESLLVNPVPRGALVAGKWLAASVASFVAVALTMGFCILLLKRVLAPDMNIRVSLGAPQIATMLLAAVSVCPLAAALQACVGAYSRSFKEAQSYMGVLMTLPVMAIGVIGAIYPLNSETWMYAIPLLSQYMLVTGVMGGEIPGVAAFVLTVTTSLGVAGLMVLLTTRLFRSERIISVR